VSDVDGPSHRRQKNALYQVSEQGNVTMVQTLLRLGANVHIQCENYSQRGEAALHAACYHCRSIEVVEELLNAGANVNVASKQGKTPLLRLAEYQEEGPTMDKLRLQIARLLLEAKSDVNCKDRWGDTVMSIAIDHELHELVQLLMEYGAIIPPDALFGCKRHKKPDTMAVLLKYGLNVDATDGEGKTVLHHVAADGNEALVNVMLQAGANVKQVCHNQWTALHTTCYR